MAEHIHAKAEVDLDALERAFDQAEEIPFVRMPTLRAVVAELRASRKVVDAAWMLRADATGSYSKDSKYWTAVTNADFNRLVVALDEAAQS